MNTARNLTTTAQLPPQPKNRGAARGIPRAAWQTLAASFDPISLAQMEGVALLDRLDTKFVLSEQQLWQALSRLQGNYWMLEVDGQRLNRYRTLYFDTPGFDMYLEHVNGRPERYKVRSREYTDTQLAFLEVKHRTRKDRTVKERIQTDAQVVAMDPSMRRWLHDVSPIDGSALEPRLWNAFQRMTLVNKRCCERVTLDVGLAFSSEHKHIRLSGIAVAEVKMDAGGRYSPFLAQMRAERIQPRGFSKYATGVALVYDEVKKNSLKPRLLWLERLMKGSTNDAATW